MRILLVKVKTGTLLVIKVSVAAFQKVSNGINLGFNQLQAFDLKEEKCESPLHS